jgi:hypothetical protein
LLGTQRATRRRAELEVATQCDELLTVIQHLRKTQ